MNPTATSISQSPVLQGKVQATHIAPEKTFQEVMDDNPHIDWVNIAPEQKENATKAYLSKYVEPLPDFQALPDESKNEFYTAFNKKYDVGHVPLNRNINAGQIPLAPAHHDPFTQFSEAVKLGTFGIPEAIWDVETGQVGSPYGAVEGNNAELSSYQNDPGLLGDLYRLRKNPITQGIGNAAGAMRGIGNVAAHVPEGVLSAVPGILSKLPSAAQRAIAATGIFSGAQNASDVARGRQTPLQGIGNTVLDTATAPLGGSSRLKNTAIQGLSGGASGYLSSLIADATSGRPIDFEAAKRAGLEQGAIGAGMGFGLHGGNKPTGAGKEARLPIEAAPSDATVLEGHAQKTVSAPEKTLADFAKEVHQLLSSSNPDDRITGKSLVEDYKARARDKRSRVSPEKIRKPGDTRAKQILAQLEILKEQSRAKQGKPEVNGDEGFQNLVGVIRELRAAGKTKEANLALSKFGNETQAKVMDTVKRTEGQAKSSAKREKAGGQILEGFLSATKEPVKKAGTTQEYRAPGKDEYARMAKEAKVVTGKAQKREKAGGQNARSIKQTAQTARKKGLQVELNYHAEGGESRPRGIGGESGHKKFGAPRVETVVNVDVDAKGNDIIRTIDENGQPRTRHVYHPESGSRITSMKLTEIPAKHEYVTNPDTGKAQVRDIKTGKWVAPKAVESAHYTSDIKKSMDILERVQRGEDVSIDEIMEATVIAAKSKGQPKLSEFGSTVGKMAKQSEVVQKVSKNAAKGKASGKDFENLTGEMKRTSKKGREKIKKGTDC